MKRNFTVIGLLLFLLIAGNGCRNAKHDRRETNNSSQMGRMRMGENLHTRKANEPIADSLMMKGMRRGMGPGWMGRGQQFMRHAPMRGMGPGMMRGMGRGMMRGMGPMPMDSLGWMPVGPGRWMMESIPNVTENQKKQIDDLMKKHKEEMMKLREDMSSKMRDIMETHRKEILSILTDEQKKFIESGYAKHLSDPGKAK